MPGAFLFTTNCLMPPRPSYADRVFTTGLVAYPGLVKIGDDKNFEPVIQKALELGGYAEDHPMQGINGGASVTTGFGWGTVLGAAGQVIEAVKSGKLRHIFLWRLHGARPAATTLPNSWEVARGHADPDAGLRQVPLQRPGVGTVEGLPRLMDMASATTRFRHQGGGGAGGRFALRRQRPAADLGALLVEQKAVAILFTLLALGVRNSAWTYVPRSCRPRSSLSGRALRHRATTTAEATQGDPGR